MTGEAAVRLLGHLEGEVGVVVVDLGARLPRVRVRMGVSVKARVRARARGLANLPHVGVRAMVRVNVRG